MCGTCHTMIKLRDGSRTCIHRCGELGHELGVDTVHKNIAVVDSQDRPIGRVAYIRGLPDHPQRQEARIVDIEAAIFVTETPDPPEEESSTEGSIQPDSDHATDGSGRADSDHASDGPDTPPLRRGSGIDYRLLDESTDSEEVSYTVHPPIDFAAILEANRQAAQMANHLSPSTQEAPPAQPIPPAAQPQPGETSEEEDGTTSPLRTRSGNIRGPPAPPKKRQPRAN